MGVLLSRRIEPKKVSDPDLPASMMKIGHLDQFREESFHEVEVGKKKIIIAFTNGRVYAFGNTCTHFNASLAKGWVQGKKILCPLHAASFNIKTGMVTSFPAIDCIPVYKVNVSPTGTVRIDPESEYVYNRIEEMPIVKSPKKVILVGGGPASVVCAVTLRQLAFDGRILIIAKEPDYPYDRTQLSKLKDINMHKLTLKSKDWFKALCIEIIISTEVTCVRPNIHTIIVGREKILKYDKLFLAPGCRPRLPKIKGIGSKNVFTLYTVEDALKILKAIPGKRVVILGGGFIAMELASALGPLMKVVTIVCRNLYPYQGQLGKTVGKALLHNLLKKQSNVIWKGHETVLEIHCDDIGIVRGLETVTGTQISCDVILCAMGSVPNTEFLRPIAKNLSRSEKITLNYEGYIVTDESLETTASDVYAGGDAARVPVACAVERSGDVPHWGFAGNTGRVAAYAMMTEHSDVSSVVPFFWTAVAGVNYRYAGDTGHGKHWDEAFMHGDVMSGKFCAVYRKDHQTIAVFTSNCDPIAVRFAADLEQRRLFYRETPSYVEEVFRMRPFLAEQRFGTSSGFEDLLAMHSATITYNPFMRPKKTFIDLNVLDRELLLPNAGESEKRKARQRREAK